MVALIRCCSSKVVLDDKKTSRKVAEPQSIAKKNPKKISPTELEVPQKKLFCGISFSVSCFFNCSFDIATSIHPLRILCVSAPLRASLFLG
jgi:hypothetical protein